MIKGFWDTLKKPILILAPMAGVTDTVFRQTVAEYGKPDVFFTEFVSCDGLCSVGKDKLMKDLWYAERERPIVGHIFGSKPDNFYKTSELLCELGFDGIDVNTGCPDKCVEKQGAGAALLKDPNLVKRIIRETQRGASSLPVSVKTRLGYDKNIIREWVQHLLETEPAVITIHARTRNQMSKVPADWGAIAEAVEVRNNLGAKSLIIGNGDVRSIEEARLKATQSGADGVMIGRAIFGNPWLFNPMQGFPDGDWENRLAVLLKHSELFESTYGRKKNFAIMRKFFNSYVSGFPSAKPLKVKLMCTESAQEVKIAIEGYKNDILSNIC